MLGFSSIKQRKLIHYSYLQDLVQMPNAYARADGASYVVKWSGRTLAPDEVLPFVCRPDLDYPWKGSGIRVQLKDVTANLKQAAATKKSFMGSKYQPTIIVKVDADDEGFKPANQRSGCDLERRSDGVNER